MTARAKMVAREILRTCHLPVLVALLGALPCAAQGAGETLPEQVAAVKQSLAQSQKALRTYQWVETTTVTMKGDVKSQKQMSCYYGADGTLQKLPISATPPPKKKRGLRGKIAESKKEELTETMKQAVAMVKSYVPPDPELIQKAVDAKKASLEVLQPGKIVRLVFHDYRVPGDALGITLDVATGHLAGMDVATYLGDPSHPVGLNVTMGVLGDGTSYAATTQLNLKAEQLGVDVANTGYRPKT